MAASYQGANVDKGCDTGTLGRVAGTQDPRSRRARAWNGLSVRVDKVLRYFAAGYSVNNVGAQYTVTPQMLEIDGAHSVLSREPWIEYWPSY